jgi:phthalate 4,5-cis-dihydrodiol dehydrogenase
LVADALETDDRVAIVAGADPAADARRMFAARTGATVHPDVASMCRDPGLDAVWVATPTRFHRKHAEAAAEAGHDVIVDKPMASSVADCDAVIAAAAKAGTWLLAAGVRSLDPAFAAMREVVESGAIGRLRHISATAYTRWLRRDRSPAEMDEALGGGIVFNQAPHQVDTIRLLAEGRAVRSVRAATAAWSDAGNVIGHYRAEIEFEDDLTAVLAYDGHGYLRSTDLVASDGTPSLVLADVGLVVVSGSRGAVRPAGDRLQLVTDEGPREVPVRRGDATTEAISELLAARGPCAPPPRHAGEWGRDTLEVVAALAESARTRARVQLRARKGKGS